MNTLKRIPWYGWGLIVAALGTIPSTGLPYALAPFDYILGAFVLNAMTYLIIAAAVARLAQYFTRPRSA